MNIQRHAIHLNRSGGNRSSFILAVAAGVLLLTWLGWGHWGYSVLSDYALDLTDALRLFQGDRPYRDFIPTYGPLHMTLVAPLFALGNFFFPALWILTSVLILAQLVVLLDIARTRFSSLWTVTLLVIGLACMAFAPTNSKFILGYSQSGFLASLLFTGVLWILNASKPSPYGGLALGILLGLTPFTKMDLGITGAAVAVSLFIVWFAANKIAMRNLALGFLCTWLGICAFLAAGAGGSQLLLGSTLESFGQVSLFKDHLLAFRMKAVFVIGTLWTLCRIIPVTRPSALRLERLLRGWGVLLLPAALMMDALRTFQGDAFKHLVTLNWAWLVIWTVMVADVASTILRTRSLGLLRKPELGILTPLLVISGMGFLRVLGSGWYPLNYFQPAILLMGILWLTRQSSWLKPCWEKRFSLLLFGSLILPLFSATMSCRPCPCSLEWIGTPFGLVGYTFYPEQRNIQTRILSHLENAPGNRMLLCTYGPTFHILTGMRSAALYTYFTRMGHSQGYQKEREELALRLVEERKPGYILQDREVGNVHSRFGINYGHALVRYIHEHYIVVESLNGSTLYRRKPDS